MKMNGTKIATLSVPRGPKRNRPRLERTATVLSRLVSVYEVCGQRRQALDTMAAALKAGYSMEDFGRDPELLELRKDPGYHKLVARLSNEPH